MYGLKKDLTLIFVYWVVLTCALRAHVKKPKRRNIL